MRDTALLFAAALIGFWLIAMGWAAQHPVHRHHHEPTTLEYRIDLNTADAATLQLLPGIGPSIAENVVDHRAAGHRFRQPADLEQVHRIGPRTAERVAPWIEFSP